MTGERQRGRCDLDASASEVTVIKGCRELLSPPRGGRPLMSDMKQA